MAAAARALGWPDQIVDTRAQMQSISKMQIQMTEKLDEERAIAVVNWTRPRTLRCSTITCRLSAAFSASSRLLGLKGEATRFNRKNISAIIAANVRRFGHPIKRTWFSAHTARRRVKLARIAM